jgi:hypothetical protein
MRDLRVITLSAVLLATGAAGAAQMSSQVGSPSQTPHTPFGTRPEESDGMPASVREQAEKSRQTERQKKLIADTDRLLALANELKLDMDKTTKDTMSIQVIKKAEEIEKLAHNVKERMKGTG